MSKTPETYREGNDIQDVQKQLNEIPDEKAPDVNFPTAKKATDDLPTTTSSGANRPPEIQEEQLRELQVQEINNLRSGLDKQTIVIFFNNAIKTENITEKQKSLLLLTQKGLTTEKNINSYIEELQTQLGFKGDAIDGKFGKNTFSALKEEFNPQTENPTPDIPAENQGNPSQPGSTPDTQYQIPAQTQNPQNIPDIDIDINNINTVFSKINKQEIVNFFKKAKAKPNLTEEQKGLLQLAYTGLTTPREENPENTAYKAICQLQETLKITVDGKFGRNTFKNLKQKFGLYTPRQENTENRNRNRDRNRQRPRTGPRENAEAIFNFNPDNYKYYKEYHNATDTDICATYAYGVVSDILASKGRCFPTTAVDTWKIKGQSDIKAKFDIKPITGNSKQQIINAPAGTFLTLKYKKTFHKKEGVSHVMVSLGNGVYTDLFGAQIRKIDFKSAVTFSGTKGNYDGFEGEKISFCGDDYIITTGHSCLMSPKLRHFMEGEKKKKTAKNITPFKFSQELHESTGADPNYIRALIAKENNLSYNDFYTKQKELSVTIITKKIKNLRVENAPESNNASKNFLSGIREKKAEIMNYYPTISNREYDEIAKRAMGILYQESNAARLTTDEGNPSKGAGALVVKEFVHTAIDTVPGGLSVARRGVEKVRGKDFSRGLTQIKRNNIFDSRTSEFLNKLGITKENIKRPYKCGIATMTALINNYIKIIQPMKTDPFWTKDATITKVYFGNGKSEEIAETKKVPIKGEKGRRVRTKAEIENLISTRGSKNKGIKKREYPRRKGIKNDNTFFDYLYYTWNMPSQIVYGTASLDDEKCDSEYINRAQNFVKTHTITV